MKRRLFVSLIVVATFCSAAKDAGTDEGSLMGLFKRTVSLYAQQEALKACGVTVNAGVTESDLVAFESKADMEKKPYAGLVEVLGIELEREPYTPISNSLWMCDYERVEDHGAYKEIIERLELMTGSALKLSNIEDYVDVEEGKAWVEFDFNGERFHWDAQVDNDWMDPYIIVKYNQLLKSSSSDYRIYSNHSDYGQVAFFAAFTVEQYKCFRKLSKIKLELIETQA